MNCANSPDTQLSSDATNSNGDSSGENPSEEPQELVIKHQVVNDGS